MRIPLVALCFVAGCSSAAPAPQGPAEVQIPAASAAPRPGSAWTAGQPASKPPRREPQEHNEAEAQELFMRARQAMAAGNLPEACELFLRSNEASPALGTLLNIAACEERSGNTVQACRAWLEAAEQARAGGQSARGKVAEEHASALHCR